MFNSLPFLAAEINKIGIEIILLLQKLPIIVGPQSEMFWTIYMKMADPNLVYFLYTPVLYPFFAKIMKQMMITAALGEFVSAILKRIFMTHRPYWWIHESGVYSNASMPQLQQFHLTCESAPGNPSVHVVIIASIWLVFVQRLKKYGHSIYATAWTFYVVSVFNFIIIRIYVANQFPHHVMLGLFIGLAIGHWVMNSMSTPSAWSCGQLTLTCAAVSALTGVFTLIFSIDLQQMDDMALKWCEKPLWVTLSMTPYDFMARDIGYLAGITCALRCLEKYHVHNIFPLEKKVLFTACNLSFCALTVFLSKKLERLTSFYLYVAVQHFSLAYVIVFLVPCFIGRYKIIQYDNMNDDKE